MSAKLSNLILLSILFQYLIVCGHCRRSARKPVLKENKNEVTTSNPGITEPIDLNIEEYVVYDDQADQTEFDVGQQFAKILDSTYSWARDNHPLALYLLENTKNMTEKALLQIPGSKVFLQILNDTVYTNRTMEKMQFLKQFLKKYSNYTISQLVEELRKNPKYSNYILEPKAVKALAQLPGVKDVVLDAMNTKINEIPLAISLMRLVRHIGQDIHVKQLEDPVFVTELLSNVTLQVSPFIDLELNKTAEKMNQIIKNFTFIEQMEKIKEFARNMSQLTMDYIKRSSVDFKRSSIDFIKDHYAD